MSRTQPIGKVNKDYPWPISEAMYSHTQNGVPVVWAVTGLIVAGLTLAMVVDWPVAVLAVAVLALVEVLVLQSLTVAVTADLIVARFGNGLVHRSFQLRSVREARTVRNRWYYGWGIRLTPHGWLFRVWGHDAVQIHLDSGKQYRIGTDQPEELLAAIKAACRNVGVPLT